MGEVGKSVHGTSHLLLPLVNFLDFPFYFPLEHLDFQNVATGLAGDPVPPESRAGRMVRTRSPSAAVRRQPSPSASRSQLSSRCTPRCTSAKSCTAPRRPDGDSVLRVIAAASRATSRCFNHGMTEGSRRPTGRRRPGRAATVPAPCAAPGRPLRYKQGVAAPTPFTPSLLLPRLEILDVIGVPARDTARPSTRGMSIRTPRVKIPFFTLWIEFFACRFATTAAWSGVSPSYEHAALVDVRSESRCVCAMPW